MLQAEKSEAIRSPKAEANPQRRIAAMAAWHGVSPRKMNDLAARKLQSAIKRRFSTTKEELIYNLGVVLQSMGKRKKQLSSSS
jgi:hypothetical protein